ncbi:protein of unknown function [Streptomyces murinus]
MHDPLRVHRGQPGQQLVEQDADERRRQGAVVVDQADEGAARDQVHGEQHLVVVGGPAGRGEHMGMVDAQGLFAHEAQEGVGVALLEHLGGHIAPPPVVPDAPDVARAAAPDRVGQFVPAVEHLTHDCRSSSPSGPRPSRLPPAPGGRSVLVRLVVRDRVGGAAGTVDPQELGEFGLGRGERVRGLDDVARGGHRAQQRLDLAHDPLDGGRARTVRRVRGVAQHRAPLGLLDLFHPLGRLGRADTAVRHLCRQILEQLHSLDHRGIADLGALAAHQLREHRSGEPQNRRETGLVEPEIVDQLTEERPQRLPVPVPLKLSRSCGGFLLCGVHCVSPSLPLKTAVRCSEPRLSILRSVVICGDPQSFCGIRGVTRYSGPRHRPGNPHRTPSLSRGLSSVGRAPSLHGGCQGFDSPRLHSQKSPSDLRRRRSEGLFGFPGGRWGRLRSQVRGIAVILSGRAWLASHGRCRRSCRTGRRRP